MAVTFGSISAHVRADGYGFLSLDQLSAGKTAPTNTQPPAAGTSASSQLVPPLRDPMFQQDVAGAYKTKSLTRSWYLFFEKLGRAASSATGAGVSADDLASIVVAAPSIDEEDILLSGTGTIDGTSDPVTFTPSAVGTSRYGTTFQIDDLIIWDDSDVDGTHRKFEIDKITGMNAGAWVLQRHEDGAPANQAHYGSFIGSHTGKAFYRLIEQAFEADVPEGVIPELIQWPWPNKTVAAVRLAGISASGEAGPLSQLNLASIPGGDTPAAPGYRTMNGAAYIVGASGTLAVSQRVDYRVPVQAWESVRTTYCYVKTAPTGDSLIVYPLYIEPRRTGLAEGDRKVAVFEVLTIVAGSLCSFPVADPPDGRQMPYAINYPPNMLPVAATLSTLTLPLAPTGEYIPFAHDGEIDLIVSQPSGAADLILVVQT